jgi:hypothetical protein
MKRSKRTVVKRRPSIYPRPPVLSLLTFKTWRGVLFSHSSGRSWPKNPEMHDESLMSIGVDVGDADG